MIRVFTSKRVVTPQGISPAAVIVENGKIIAVKTSGSQPSFDNVFDFGDSVLMPGLVDTHVHINEPGRTDWEGFETASRAAAAGGITTLVDMPLNCLPPTTTVDALMQKRRAANGRSYVDWAAWAGLTDHNHEHLADLASAGVRGYKCFLVDPGIEGLPRLSLNGLRRAAPILAEIGLPLLVHAELPEAIDAATNSLRQSDWKEYVTYLRSRPDEAELDAIQLLIQLCRQYRFKVHVVHLATSLAFKHLTVARQEGLPITVETCPHYLHFAAEDVVPSQTLLKCAPPIRSRQNREALWDGLKGGIIDLIVTDHSPCPPEMKQLSDGDFNRAWGGIASLPLAISVVWTGMKKRDIPLHILSNWMSRAPATLAGLQDRKGSIAVGLDADFVIFDPEATIEVTPQNLHYRHPVSAYMGEELYGNVQQTFLRGEEIYGMHKFPHAFSGTEIRP